MSTFITKKAPVLKPKSRSQVLAKKAPVTKPEGKPQILIVSEEIKAAELAVAPAVAELPVTDPITSNPITSNPITSDPAEIKAEEPAAENTYVIPLTSTHIPLVEFVDSKPLKKWAQECICGSCRGEQYNCFKYIDFDTKDTDDVASGYGYGESQKISRICDHYNAGNVRFAASFCRQMQGSKKDNPFLLIPVTYKELLSISDRNHIVEAQQLLDLLVEKFDVIAGQQAYATVLKHFKRFNVVTAYQKRRGAKEQQEPYFNLSWDFLSRKDKEDTTEDGIQEKPVGNGTYRVAKFIGDERISYVQRLTEFLKDDPESSVIFQLIVPDGRFLEKRYGNTRIFYRHHDLQFTPFVRGKLHNDESVKDGITRELHEEIPAPVAKLFTFDETKMLTEYVCMLKMLSMA